MEKIMALILLGLSIHATAQERKPKATVENIALEFNGKTVRAKKLTVSSEIVMDVDRAWENVKTPALLEFVAKGMIQFKPIGDGFPKQWKVGETYGANMRVFGFIPFGGIHYLYIENIDNQNYTIATKEWDGGAKVWNHTVVIKAIGEGQIYYEDEIVIYAGINTGFITSFAKRFYKHRQKRWQLVAKENLMFGI